MTDTAMFAAKRPYIFHVELTDKCNAGCPMCPRTDALNFCKADRTKVFNVELGLDDFREHFRLLRPRRSSSAAPMATRSPPRNCSRSSST